MRSIKFLGAAGMVTGSNYRLVSDSGQEILIDMGMFQGLASETAWNHAPFAFDPKTIDGVILTHAHLDHCGRLPLLGRFGFKGKIYMTPATRDLVELSLFDTAKVATDNPQTALFDQHDVEVCLRQMTTVDYHQNFRIGDFAVKFYDAGHLLGSASVEIIDVNAKGPMKKIIFSGDLGNTPQYIIKPTEMLSDADFVVMESTYGDAIHPSDSPLDVLEKEVNEISKNGGTLLIPCFALERTQDLLYLFRELVSQNRVNPNTGFFLDSPMAIKATEIYRQYSSLFNVETQEILRHENPFNFSGLEIVEDYKYSMSIKRSPGPKVIIAGSGMMTGGRILSHAKNFLPQKNTRVLFVGYQGEETLGRQVLEGASQILIDKKPVKIRAKIDETKTLSSHADQPRLLNWLKHIQNVKKVFITHGENPSRQVLCEKIKSELNITNITLPKMNEEITFQ